MDGLLKEHEDSWVVSYRNYLFQAPITVKSGSHTIYTCPSVIGYCLLVKSDFASDINSVDCEKGYGYTLAAVIEALACLCIHSE